MRRTLGWLAAVAAAASIAPAHAGPDVTRRVRWPVAGTVANSYNPLTHALDCANALLARDPLGCASARHGIERSSVTRLQRCAYVTAPSTAQDEESGLFGYVITLVPADSGRAFTLSGAGEGSPLPDFDVTFYGNGLGTCEANAPEPTLSFSRLGDESGIVPAGATHAIVAMFAGPSDSGFRFVVTAG
jgi:hypothetical protein